MRSKRRPNPAGTVALYGSVFFSDSKPRWEPMATGKEIPSNVIPLPGLEMPGLGVASTAAKGTRISGSRNEVWLCQAYANGDQGLMLFVKPALPLRALMIEALSAQIGQCMGLPCPNPYLVTVNPVHVGQKAGRKILAFGSEQIGNRALARSVPDTDVMLELLDRQKLTEQLCAFDEFIANGVRGPRDIMFDPEHGAAIIDHEGAMEASTRPDDAVTNWLAARVLERTTPDQRPQLLKKLRARAAAAHRMKLGLIPAAVQFDQQGVSVYRQLLDFLQARLLHLDRLLSARVLPDQKHISESNQDHASGTASDI